MTKNSETYYELLKVAPNATVSEIVAAYNTAKATFSRDSMAAYSLFSEEETQEILAKLETAFQTLSNLDKKRAYDRSLTDPGFQPPAEPAAKTATAETKTSAAATPDTAAPAGEEPVTGAYLKSLRNHRGLSVEDVARITKIPSRFVRAIEEVDEKALPARVYLQGFVKNLAALYKVPSGAAAQTYLQDLEAKLKPQA